MPGPWEKYTPQPAEGPWAKYTQKEPEVILSQKGAEAGLAGFGQQATFGHLPQLQAMAEPLTSRAYNLLPGPDVEPAPWGQMIGQGPEYVSARDRYAAQLESQKKQSPISYGAGSVGGFLTGAALPAAGVGKLAKGAGAFTKASLGGAAAGALESPGFEKGEESSLELGQRAKQAGFGAVAGLAGEGLVKGIGKAATAIKQAPGKMRELSDLMAYRSLGSATKKQIQTEIKKAGGNASIRELGKFAREKGLVRGGDNIDDVFAKVMGDKQKTGEQIGLLYKGVADDMAKVNPKSLSKEARQAVEGSNLNPSKLANEIESLIKKDWTGEVGGTDAIRAVKGQLQNLRMKGNENIGIQELHKFRQGLDDIIYDKATDNVRKKALIDMRRHMQDVIDKRIDVADKLFSNETTKALKLANKDYKLLSKAGDLATSEVARQQANRIFSLTDKIMGGAMLASQAPGLVQNPEGAITTGLLTGAAMLGSKGARSLGAPLLMKSSEATGKAIQELGGLIRENLKNVPLPKLIKELSNKYGKQKVQELFNNPELVGALSGKVAQ